MGTVVARDLDWTVDDSTGEIKGYNHRGGHSVTRDFNTSSAIGPVSGVRTVLFGHSYIANETGGDPVADKFDNFQILGTVVVANALMGSPLRIIKNVSAGGRRLIDLFPRYATEVAPLRPRLVFMSVGHNDIKGLYQGFSDQIIEGSTDVQRNLSYLIARFKEFMKTAVGPETTVVLFGETPPGVDPAGSTSANNQVNLSIRFQKWNRMMANLCAGLNGYNVVYVPLDQAIVDPTSLTMKNKAGYYYDTVHPGIVGTFARAQLLIQHLARIIPIHVDELPTWQGDNYTNAKIATTNNPVFADGVCTVLFDNTKIGDFRKIEVGEWVTLMIPHSTNSTLGGRYRVLTATDAGVTLAVPTSLAGTTTLTGFISNSQQLFVNPLLTTTTGGQAAPSGVLGSVTGNVPAGIDINNVPATYSITVTSVAHTKRDGSAGFGNWMKLAISVSGSSGATQCEVRIRFAATSPVNAAYDNDRKVNQGQTIKMVAEVKQESATGGFAGIAMDVQGNVTDPPGSGNSVTYRTSTFYRDTNKIPVSAAHPWPADDMTFTLVTPEMTFEPESLKANRIVTNADGRIYINFSADGTVNLYIGRIGLLCVDDPLESLLINTPAGS